MSTKSYLRIDGIKGTAAIYIGSPEPVRTGDIPLIRFFWGNSTFTDGRPSSPPLWPPINQAGFLNVTRYSDATSSTFYKALASRDHFATILLIVNRDQYGYAPLEIYEMTDVLVFSMTNYVDSNGDTFEAITFKFNGSKPPRVASPSSMGQQ